MVAIRRAVAEDAAALARLAARTFEETFADANNADDLGLYIETTYGAAQQRAEITSPDIVTWLAEDGEVLAGFAQLRAGPPPDCVTDSSALELWRLYVDAPWHGTGVAAALMSEAWRRRGREARRRSGWACGSTTRARSASTESRDSTPWAPTGSCWAPMSRRTR